MFMSGSCSRIRSSDEPLASIGLIKRPRGGGFVHKPLDEKRNTECILAGAAAARSEAAEALLLHCRPKLVFGLMEALEAFVQMLDQLFNLGLVGIRIGHRIAQGGGGIT